MTQQREVVLETIGLSKTYGTQQAVNDLNLKVCRGEIYGFLGKNGAGKTTTIRMLLGLIKSSQGEARILGETITAKASAVYERVGSLVESPGFYPNLTVYDNLDVHRRLLGFRTAKPVEEVLEQLNLASDEKKRASALSLGNKQRLGLARALLNKPEVLILDEPTNGLDPAGIREIRNLLKELAEERQTTIFISSHILSEVQQLATKVGIIHQGRLLEEIGYQELRLRNRTYVELKVSNTARAAWVLEDLWRTMDFSIHEDQIVRVYSLLDQTAQLNSSMLENDVDISWLVLREENLEDHFIKLTQENLVPSEQRRIS